MNTTQTKKKLLKLMIASVIVVIAILMLKSYYYYQNIKSEIILDAKREAHLLQDYMMSVRETFHKQFLSSGIELNDSTLGFLPAHATTLISDKFQKKNNYNFYIRNVSDNPRNKINMADKEEMKAIKYFKNKPEKDEYFKKYTNQNGEYFQFASPIYIKQYCLACHGKRENALPTIRDRYDSAYDYKVGDIRGIVSIKIPNDDLDNRFYNYFKRELLVTILTFLLMGIVFFILFRKVFFQIKHIETTAINYATKDALTNLYNRKFLTTLKEIHKTKKYNNFVVAFLDIDYFKKINDTYGHDMGDKVLKEFALILQNQSRKEDIICRYGGEEFLIIVYDISREIAIEKFNNIRIAVENHEIKLGDKSINITISIGLDIGTDKNSIKNSISNADKALYEAKKSGRNRIEIYNK